MAGCEAEGAGNVFAGDLVQHAQGDHGARNFRERAQAAREANVVFGGHEQIVHAGGLSGERCHGGVVAVVGRGVGMAAAAIAGKIAYQGHQKLSRGLGFIDQRAGLRQGDKGDEGFLNCIERFVWPQTFVLGDPRQRGAVLVNQTGYPREEPFPVVRQTASGGTGRQTWVHERVLPGCVVVNHRFGQPPC